jgi:hypothetical protein
VILALIALAAAVPRIWLGASQFVEYDGYWHVFIAQQDNWKNFWADIYANAHPPLYFLLLKAALHFGHSLLVYRSISLLTGIASVFLTGLIALKVMGSKVRAYQSALAYGLALPGIIVSCEVRSYMLSVFFVLLSFWWLLDLAEPGADPAASGSSGSETKSRAGFAAGTILACLSHYFAFFYAGAAILLLLGRFVGRKAQGKTASWRAEAATSLPVIAVIGTLYKVHAGRLAQIQGHLIPYYYDPKGHETVTSFLVRNWMNFVNLFSPYQLSSVAAALGVLILALAGGVWVLVIRGAAARESWTMGIAALILGGFVATALAGKYPFGGDLRQQYLLFPFLVLWVAILVERTAGQVSGFVPVYGRAAANALLIAAIVWISSVRFEQYPKISGNVADERMQLFDSLAPAPTAVYLDQFNLILFFIYHHTWEWSSVKLQQPIEGIDLYRLRRGTDQMLVFRDKTDWDLDPDDSAAYGKFAECLRSGRFPVDKTPELSIFGARQSPPKEPFNDVNMVRREIVTLASNSAVCVQRLAVNSVGWYVTFRQSNCASLGIHPVQATGTFDDGSEDIRYGGLWTHASNFPAAASGTVSYSNAPGAWASVSFEGNEITWVYTKAFNRGIAEVKLDGLARGDIDLYSPKIVWQARQTFKVLAPGKHTFEVTVSGKKDAAATDRYVDLDAFIVN